MSAIGSIGRHLGPAAHRGSRPDLTTVVRARGAAPRDPRRRAAAAGRAGRRQAAREQHGDVDRAVHEVIENHVRYAGAQGFVTNLGGAGHRRGHDPRQHHRAGADPVPDDRRASRTCAATTSTTRGCATRSWPACSARTQVDEPGQEEEAAGAADGAGHRARPRPRPRPGHLRRGRLRPDHARSPASGSPSRSAAGSRSSAAWSARAPTATPPGGSAATPTASSCPAPAVDRAAARGPAGRPAAGARPSRGTGTSAAGRPAPARAASRASSRGEPLLGVPQPGVLEQQRRDRVDARRRPPAPRRAGRGRPSTSQRRRADAGRRGRRPRRTRARLISSTHDAASSCAHGWTSGGSASRGRAGAPRQRLVGEQLAHQRPVVRRVELAGWRRG